ncbi:AbrB family transcriptional regulator [Burkholderiaceae bacterium FT117]|uniref:AbrB family transcriptional regulator n=1 Tax=Zeimonas sediminis TaxID=2944268 RepID=UPI0023431916|nr:AbrB family transcriptional regulator [Zeimonas sediminis]MCM5571014.1 AbrB family transcriptional regulator [Zeimonas sediminis]
MSTGPGAAPPHGPAAPPDGEPGLPAASRAFALAVVVGTVGGALFAWIGTPLPWLLGALFACAASNLAGAGLRAPVVARHAGQWVIGAALGLYFTPDALERLLALGPYIAAGAVYAILLGFAFAWSLFRFARVDVPTAFFAGAIGGASEMAAQGERAGGSVQLIAAAHVMRILLVVSTLPFVYQWLRVQGTDAWTQSAAAVEPAGLALLVGATCAGGLLVRRLGAPNAWVIGPLLVAGGLTGSGVALSSLPAWVIVAGQVLIGIALGSRFRPGFFAEAPRFLAVVAASTLAGIAVSALFGWALARAAGISPATMILATSPGAIAEMSLTAKALRLGVPVVAVFHVMRYVVLVLTVGVLYRLALHAIARRC